MNSRQRRIRRRRKLRATKASRNLQWLLKRIYAHDTADLAAEVRAAYIPGVTLQREIAERFGITQAQVSNIYLGKQRLP